MPDIVNHVQPAPAAVPQAFRSASATADPEAPTDPESRQAYEEIQTSYRRTREQYRRLWQNRPQSWRHLLNLLCGAHLTILFGRFIGDILFWGPRATELNKLSGTASVIAVATRLTWRAMFSNPYSFLGYRRPGVGYRRAVMLVTFLTTIPALCLHVAMIPAAYRARRTALSPDPYQVILAMVLLIPTIGLYLWMLKRFLFRGNDEHYEPTIPMSVLEESTAISGTGGPARYSDSTGEPWQPQSSPLSRAFAQQRVRRRTRNDALSETSTPSSSTDSGQVEADPSPASQDRQEGQPTPGPGQNQCQTIAWFDYMPRSRLSDPLIVYGLMIYGIILTWMIYIFIQENSLSKLSSPKAKEALYAPLGILLYCAFANKRFLRTSFFARIEMAPPHPWSIVPSLWGKRPTFRNSEDGALSKTDPRIRVPLHVKYPSYLQRYNETARACECQSYWGHLGRKRITDPRLRPPILRFAFLALAFFFFAKGFVALIQYPTHARDGELNRPDLTDEDLQRHYRILALMLKLEVATGLLGVFLVFYTLAWGLRLMLLWGEAILKYGPARREEREPEGQIRL
ncbi:hypothetical protein V8F20_009420 [Naviculisporaceae sp. PSN 640]